TIGHDARGRVTSRRTGDGALERIEYDDAARTQRRIDATGAATLVHLAADGRVLDTTDPRGARTRVEQDAAGLPVTIAGPGGGVRIERDVQGRPVATQDAGGSGTRFD